MKTLSDFGILCESGVGEHYTHCPECSQKRKKNPHAKCLSVKIESDGAVWFCHHCGWKGSLRDGTSRRSDPSSWKPDEWTRPVLKGVGKWRDEQLAHFKARGISKAVLDRNRVTVERVWIPQTEEFEDAVAFPFYRNGGLINIKYRGKNKNFRMASNAERIFCGLDDITYKLDAVGDVPGAIVAQEIAIIVEGEMDKLAMEVAGYANTISTPNGAPSPNTKDLTRYFDFIAASNHKLQSDDEQGLLDSIKTFFIAVDSDEPGRKLEEELVRRLDPDRCVRVRWPRLPLDHEPVTLWDRKTVIQPGDQLKDANEVLFCLGAEAIQVAIKNARPVPIDGIYTVEDYEEKIWDYYHNGLPTGVAVGGDAFRDAKGAHCLHLQTKTTWVVTGIPGHGKSRWVENLITHLIVKEDWAIAHFSPEVRPLELQATYFMSQALGVPFEKGERARMTEQQVKEGINLLRNRLFSYEAGLMPFSVDDLLVRATKLVKKHGVRGLVIDPWNNLYHAQNNYEREDQYVGRALQQINAWRAKYDVWVCIVAHPTKLNAINGVEPVAQPNHIKGGAEFYSMADFIMSVWRDKMHSDKPSHVHILKSKFHHLATLGVAQMYFDKPTLRYSPAGEPFGAVTTSGSSMQAKRFTRNAPPPENYFAGEPDSGYGEPPRWMQGPEYDV